MWSLDGGDGWLLLPPSLLSHKRFWRNCFSVWAVLFWMMRDEHKHMYCIFSFENLKCHYLPQVVYFLLCAPRKPNLWIEFCVCLCLNSIGTLCARSKQSGVDCFGHEFYALWSLICLKLYALDFMIKRCFRW